MVHILSRFALKTEKIFFWNKTNSVGANRVRPKQLSDYGNIVNNAIVDISKIYPNVNIDKYVIMPNHIHIIISICANGDIDGRTRFAPTIGRIVKQTKGRITKQIGFSVWQKSFYEHIIRNQADYNCIWKYIDENPTKWELDRYYTP